MTLTKEWLQQTIAELEEERDAIPEAVNEDAAMALAAMKLALASMTAEPVMYTVTFEGKIEEIGGDCQGFKREECQQYIEWLRDEDNQDGYAVTPLFTAPPAPVVQDVIAEIRVGRLPTMNQDDYPGLGDWWVQLRIGEDSDEVLARVYGATPQEANGRAETLACRAAMLQGAADNSPAFPDGYALVPVALTSEMREAARDCFGIGDIDIEWSALLAAAPQQENVP